MLGRGGRRREREQQAARIAASEPLIGVLQRELGVLGVQSTGLFLSSSSRPIELVSAAHLQEVSGCILVSLG